MKKKIVLGMLVLSLCLLGNAFAADTTWTGGGDGTSWADPLNWDTGAVPGAGDDVIINSGTPGAASLYIAENGMGDTCDTLTLTGGVLTANCTIGGPTGPGAVVQTGGTLNGAIDLAGVVYTGDYRISGGSLNTGTGFLCAAGDGRL